MGWKKQTLKCVKRETLLDCFESFKEVLTVYWRNLGERTKSSGSQVVAIVRSRVEHVPFECTGCGFRAGGGGSEATSYPGSPRGCQHPRQSCILCGRKTRHVCEEGWMDVVCGIIDRVGIGCCLARIERNGV